MLAPVSGRKGRHSGEGTGESRELVVAFQYEKRARKQRAQWTQGQPTTLALVALYVLTRAHVQNIPQPSRTDPLADQVFKYMSRQDTFHIETTSIIYKYKKLGFFQAVVENTFKPALDS